MRPTVVVHQKPNPCHFVREGHMSLKSHTVTLMSIFPLLQHYVSIYQILNGLKSIKFDAKFAAENTLCQKRALSLEAAAAGAIQACSLIVARSC